MKRKLILLAAAAALLGGGFAVTQLFAGENSPLSRGHVLQRIASRLNLTADQRQAIRSILVSEKATLLPLLNSLPEARKNLRAALHAGDATEASVRAAAAKVAAVEADLAVERLKLSGKIRPLLTPGQLAQVAAMEQRAEALAERVIAQIGAGLDN